MRSHFRESESVRRVGRFAIPGTPPLRVPFHMTFMARHPRQRQVIRLRRDDASGKRRVGREGLAAAEEACMAIVQRVRESAAGDASSGGAVAHV